MEWLMDQYGVEWDIVKWNGTENIKLVSNSFFSAESLEGQPHLKKCIVPTTAEPIMQSSTIYSFWASPADVYRPTCS